MTEHQSYSIHYRISTGFQKGKKVFSLQTRPTKKFYWHTPWVLDALRSSNFIQAIETRELTVQKLEN